MHRNRRAQNRRAGRANYNRKTLLWLLLCFPVGLTRMWHAACSWKAGVKYAVSGLVVVALAAALLYPSPDFASRGGVEVYGQTPEVEVYGPELPENIVGGYTVAAVDTVIVDDDAGADDTVYVYAAKGAECYHMGDCKFAFASAQRLTVYEAKTLGFRPCGRCNPPVQ